MRDIRGARKTVERLPKTDAYGNPHYGRMVREARLAKGWNADMLAWLYSRALREPVTGDWILDMEFNNKLPQDPGRRTILAVLLGISPALFVPGIEKILEPQEPSQKLDLQEYQKALSKYWTLYDKSAERPALPEIQQRIFLLHENVLYRDTKQIMALLCNYQILLGCILRNQGHYEDAITSLNKAVMLAKENESIELYAAALYRRGFASFNVWETRREKAYLTNAINDYDAAWEHEKHLPEQLRGVLLLDGGLAYAHTTDGEKSRTKALSMIEDGGKIARSPRVEAQDYVHLDAHTYSNIRGAALIAMERFRTADDELSNVVIAPHLKRRRIHNRVLQSKAQMGRGWHSLAVETARSALQSAVSIGSRINIDRVATIYQDMQTMPKIGNTPDVALLGVDVMKARYRELFS